MRAAPAVSLEDFASTDPAMSACLDRARVAATTDLPILILGESGTGKTVLARAIHESSRRAAGPFVSFNAAALSDTLLDSQLFGHERGAFTGALRQVKGKFELADGGTLFIDEIADMAATAQAKILRAVEYGEFERLGSEVLRRADVRPISATHLAIERFLEAEHFRRDLFYRISGITVRVPPLRERPNDLRMLLSGELSRAATELDKPVTGISREAIELLLAHSWPGNLRELQRVVHTAVALTRDAVVRREAVLLDGPPTANGANRNGAGGHLALEPDLSLHTAELRHIHMVLEKMNGNKRRAARVLKLSRSTLDRKLGGRRLGG